MSQIPNWFRWLIIVIATLIMCACRSPLQNPQTRGIQSVLLNTDSMTEALRANGEDETTTSQTVAQHIASLRENVVGYNVSPRLQTQLRTNSSHATIVGSALQSSSQPQHDPHANCNHGPTEHERIAQRTRVIELLQGKSERDYASPVSYPTYAIRPPIAVAHAPATPAKPVAAELANATIDKALAPVIKQTDDGLRLQEVRSSLRETLEPKTQPIAAVTSSANDAAQASARAVYLRVNDAEKIARTNAQLDADVGSGLGSQFGNHLDVPIMNEAPVGPPLDPNIAVAPIQTQPAPVQDARGRTIDDILGPPSQEIVGQLVVGQPVVGQPIASQPHIGQPIEGQIVDGQYVPYTDNYVEGQPMLVEDAALPLYHEPEVYLPAPYEEFLPIDEVPIEVAPENWADNPYEGLNERERELAKRHPDEYICDGGDANGPVYVMNDWSLRNLDPEDTIGHYDTKANEVVVEASNKVCVYAPRFAAARKVESPFQNEKHEQLLVAARGEKAFSEHLNAATNQLDKTIAPTRHVLMQPASSFRQRQAGVVGIQRKAVNIFAYDVSTHEDFRVMKLGIHKNSEKPRLADFAARASTWTSDKAIQVLVDDEAMQTLVTRRGPETFFTIGDNGPAKLRVIKTADKADALPGEEIVFTLRFDNVGFQEISNVTVVDNLTTRLEFIEDSDLCSEECTFNADENDAESLTLRWQMKEPIKPGEGGLIRFRCRVR